MLLVGGLDCGNLFDELLLFFKNVKVLIVFGEIVDKIGCVGKIVGIDVYYVDNVEVVVLVVYCELVLGDIILFLLVCVSWD